MDEKTKKTLFTIIIIIIYAILIFLNICSSYFTNALIGHICYIVPLVWTLITYIYKHWNFLFEPVNRIWAILTGVTSSFQLSYRFSLKDKDFKKDYPSFFSEFSKNYSIIHQNNQTNYKVIKYEKEGLHLELDFKINPSNYDNDDIIDQIVIILNTSVAYRDSVKVIEYFFNAIDIIDKVTGAIVDESKLDNISENKFNYGCIIELSKYNPFYRYQITHISTEKFPEFKEMKLQDTQSQICITPHKMIIKTFDKDYLKAVVKEYIPISNIG